MPLILQGATSGQATVQATDAATVTLTLPASTGTLVVTGGAQTIEFADGSASAPSITNSGDTNTGMFFPTADTIAFTEGGTEAMRLDSAGNVGIGTSSPAYALDVRSTAAPAIRLSRSGSAGQIASMVFEDGNATLGSGNTTRIASDSGAMSFNTGGTSGAITGGTERMRITSAGNVGIGTTSPTSYSGFTTLSLNNASQGGVLDFLTNNARQASIYSTASEFGIYGNTAIPMIFSTNTAERMRITSGGQLLVGTTTGTTLSSVAWNTTLSSSSGNNFAVINTDTGGATTAAMQSSNWTGGGANIINFYNGSGNVAGTISVPTNSSTTTTVSYNTSSDYRMKENIAPMTGALSKVTQLKPVTYTWKANGYSGQGFIAHELAEVVPECVTGEKDAMRTEKYEISPAIEATYDEEGNELTPAVEAVMGEREVPDYQGIDTSFLVATLTAAIQELKATVDAQAARIAALEGAK
jgi:hypothetical protein